jgi:hypothetical protein
MGGMEKLKELPRAFGFGSALASAVAVVAMGGWRASTVPYCIQVLRSGCRLTGSLWSLCLVVAALPPRGVGYRAEREMLRTACVPVDRTNMNEHVDNPHMGFLFSRGAPS